MNKSKEQHNLKQIQAEGETGGKSPEGWSQLSNGHGPLMQLFCE